MNIQAEIFELITGGLRPGEPIYIKGQLNGKAIFLGLFENGIKVETKEATYKLKWEEVSEIRMA